MRKFIGPALILILLVPAYFIFEASHPRTAERFPIMVLLLLVDIYLWFSIRKKVYSLPAVLKIPVSVLYWLPLAAFVILTAASSFKSVHLFNKPLISYVIGVVLVIYFSKLLTVIFFLLADLYKIILYVFRHNKVRRTGKPVEHAGNKMSRGRFLRTMGLATGGLFFSGMLIGMVKWAHDFRVHFVTLRLPKLPAGFDGFKIVQISDLHLGSWASTEPIEEVVEIVNDLDADLVVFTGDLVNYTTSEAFRFREALSGIRPKGGIYAILGNHDYGDYVNWPSEEDKKANIQQMYDYFGEVGWRLLRNEHEVLEKEGGKLALIGVENWSASHRFPKLGHLPAAMKGTEDIPVKILLSHDPTHFEHEVSRRFPEIDLTLSGHTHGFQFGVELRKFKWSLAQYVYKYWAGLYQTASWDKPQYLYVNRGLGMIGYPGRVGILPEITLITLRS